MAARLARERATDELINNLLPRVTFVEQLHSSVLCCLCNDILKNPMQLSCGHRVCKSCNENSIPTINGGRHCPLDNELIEGIFPDRSALTDIMNLVCFCVAQRDGCNWQGLLLDLEEHAKKCEYFVQIPCPYLDFQCKYMGSRAGLEAHLRENSIKHDSLLATSLRELMNTVSENNAVLSSTKAKTVDIEQAFVETNKELATFQSKLRETAAIIDNQDQNSLALKKQSNVLNELILQSEGKKGKFVEFHNKFKELVRNVENQMKYINESEKSGTEKDSVPNPKKSLVEKTKRLEEENKAHDKQIADLGVKIRIYQCSSNDGVYTWKLDNLQKRIDEARSGKVTELYTPPLYTSPFGYKYSAKVMLDGEKDKVANNSANHVAFYIVVMQGDFDEILEFPFPYPITITLLNTSKKANVSHTLYPDPNKVHFHKPYKSMNHAIGFARFVSHDKLYKDGFIKDNAIYFKIKVEKAGVKVKEPNI